MGVEEPELAPLEADGPEWICPFSVGMIVVPTARRIVEAAPMQLGVNVQATAAQCLGGLCPLYDEGMAECAFVRHCRT